MQFQTEHVVRDYCLSMQRPSTVAMAAIFSTIDQDQVNKKDSQAILHALLLVVNQDFACPEYLMAAKNRLVCLLKGVHEVFEAEDATVVSESSQEVEASSSFSQYNKRELEDQVEKQTANKIPRTSPQIVTPRTSVLDG